MACNPVQHPEMRITEQVPADPRAALEQSKRVMQQSSCWDTSQQMGRRWAVGCVALEITQRCNLDCTLCYLSEHSEAVKDVPLELLFRRIDDIHLHYGPGTNIQVTGGDPTLRKRHELVEIVRYIRAKNMRSTLMTNGILASRSLLRSLARAGLNDVAFHVDTTQERQGFTSEKELNTVRREYVDRAKGLGLLIMFNTTIHRGNFHEIPVLVRFFRDHARHLRIVSFQLQADTGRGIERERDVTLTPDTVWQQIQSATKTPVRHDTIRAGHPACNRYGVTIVVNRTFHDLLDDADFVSRVIAAASSVKADRNRPVRTAMLFLGWLCKNPRYVVPLRRWLLDKCRTITPDLLQARGRMTTLSFLVHNFMDADNLDPERIRACAFKVMTPEGPVSMCQYNARRDDYILRPQPIGQDKVIRFWHPLSGDIDADSETGSVPVPLSYPLKKLKGRSRFKKLRIRQEQMKETAR